MVTQIELFGEIQVPMINRFLDFVTERLADGESEFIVAISSGGGNVFCGLTAYNFLKGCGAEVTTHNIGHVHSIAGVIYCAGSKRLTVPSGRFLVHDVWWGLGGGSYSEAQLRENLEGLRGDRRSVATVLSEAMSADVAGVEEMMTAGRTLHSDEAVEAGLATEVGQQVFVAGERIHRFRTD